MWCNLEDNQIRKIETKPQKGLRPAITLGIVAFNTPLSTLSKLFQSVKASDVTISTVLLCNSQNPRYQTEVKRLCEANEVIFLGNQSNKGFGKGHNTIANTFPSDWYICCNPDVVVKKNTISELIRFAEESSDSILLMPRVCSPDGTIQPLARKTLTPVSWLSRQLWRFFPNIIRPFELCFDYYTSQPVEFVTGCFFAIRRAHFEALGGFDESFFLYSEDADLSYRATKLGVNYFVASSEITHIWTTNATRNLRTVKQELKSLYKYFNKHNLWFSPFNR